MAASSEALMEGFIVAVVVIALLVIRHVGVRLFEEKPIMPRVWWDTTDPFNDKKPPPAR